MQQNMTIKQTEVTKEGLDELKKELQELTDIKLPEVIERVARAREYGDLSENAEYHSAREDQQLIEARIDEIQAVINTAHIVTGSKGTSKITIGSTVIATIKDKKSKITFHMVGEFEANPMENKISIASPVGKALMSKKKGDEVKVVTPGGEVIYIIEEIK